MNGKTEILVDVNTNDEFTEMFEDVWQKALQKLKEPARNNKE
jgi:hypothetical protein